ncbi:MAG: hypothetical protein ACT4P1_13315 [Sporichthyaceae bacterium]
MIIRAIRTALVVVLAAGALPLVTASAAQACSCMASDEISNFERAGVVFKGSIEAATSSARQERGKPATTSGITYIFTPATTYKGETLDPQQVFTPADSAACGVELDGDGPFLVFANIPDRDSARQLGIDQDTLTMNACGGTRPIGADEEPNFERPPVDTSPFRGGPDAAQDPEGFAEFVGDEAGTLINNLQRIRPL